MGAFGGSGDDIQIRVTLDTAGAEAAAQSLKTTIEQALAGTGAAAKPATTGVQELTKVVNESSKATVGAATQAAAAATGFGALRTAAAGAATAVTTLAASVATAVAPLAALGVGFAAITKLAAAGDEYSDVANAFEENARAAGVLADELRGNLSAALDGAVSNFDLMTTANKAFAAGIKAETFDDLAAAAKRYADATGGDAKQALEQLIQGVSTGRETLLKKFGTVRDGVLILDEFSRAQAENAQQELNVTNVIEQFTAATKNAYREIAQAVNDSEALKLALQGLGAVVGTVAGILKDSLLAVIELTNGVIRDFKQLIDEAVSSFLVFKEILNQIDTNGGVVDFGKAIDTVARSMTKASKEGEKVGKVTVALGKGAGEAAKKTRDLKKALDDAFETSDIGLAESLGLETFVLPDGFTSLKDAITGALRNVDPTDIYRQLQGVRAAFLDGLTGNTEEGAQEIQKRISIFNQQVQKAMSEQERLGALNADRNTFLDEERIRKEAENNAGLFGETFRNYLKDELKLSEGTIDNLEIGAIFGDQVFSGLRSVLADGKINSDDTAAIGATIGAAIGTAIGAYFGGPAGAAAGAGIGSSLGGFVAEITRGLFGEDGPGTRARKEADRFFADVFDADRLAVVINGQVQRIRDLVFNPSSGGGFNFGAANEAAFVGGPAGVISAGGAAIAAGVSTDNPSFNGETFDDNLQAQEEAVKGYFFAVGSSLEELLGLSDDIAGQIGAILFNNIGGSLQNLQVLVQTLGYSFQQLGDEIFNAFFDGTLSIEEAYDRLVKLEDLFRVGIPGAVGDVEGAVNNFQVALADGKGSRFLIDSLRDIGAESQELGNNDLPALINQIGSYFGFTSAQIAQLFEAAKASGINSLTDLVNASNAQLLTFAENVRRIQAGIPGVVGTPQDPTAGTTPPTNFTPGTPPTPVRGGGGGGFSSGSSGPSKAEREAERAEEEAKRRRKQLFEETYRLLTASAQYGNILDAVTDSQLAQNEASKQIRALFQDIKEATQELEKAETRYQKALQNRKKVSKDALAGLAENVRDAEKRLEDLTETSREANRAFKFDLSAVTPLIRDMNQLGVVLKSVGVSADQSVSVLVKGFLAGKLSITEVNAEINKTLDLMGKGIPGVVGAADQAFQNIIKGGRQGGAFSVDAFRDVFAEFEEFFKTNSGPAREADRKRLTEEFDAARDSLQAVLATGSPEEIQAARDRLTGAKKALDDFLATKPEAGFEDLRAYLKERFDPEQIDIFFRGLSESGINTFVGFKDAGDDAIVKILGSLDELGFAFGETDQTITDINNGLNDTVNKSTDGKDVLQEWLNIITGINAGAGGLPSVFDSTNTSLGGVSDTVARLGGEFDTLLEKLIQLDGQRYESEIVFNVRANPGDSTTEGLLDLLFPNGVIDETPDGPGLSPDQITRKKKRLRALIKAGKGNSPRAKRLREELAGSGASL